MLTAFKTIVLQAHSASLYALAPGRTKGMLFSAGADKVVAEWDVNLPDPNPFAIRTERTVYSLLNLDRKQLVIGTIVGGMHIIDLETKQEIRHLKFHDKGIFYLLELPQQKKGNCGLQRWLYLDLEQQRLEPRKAFKIEP